MCIRPHTGELFTTTIDIAQQKESEEDGTSECNPVLRKEAKEIYKSIFRSNSSESAQGHDRKPMENEILDPESDHSQRKEV